MLNRSNSFLQDDYFDNKKKEKKAKTCRILVICLIVAIAFSLLFTIIFGTLYGTELAVTVALKKNISESCLTYECNDLLQLICKNQICTCNGSLYWNGYSCATYP